MATGEGAAARLRSRINREGGSSCGGCGWYYPAPLIKVDHSLALSNGGQDIDSNVWSLCDGPGTNRCHQAKTTAEQRRPMGPTSGVSRQGE